MYRWNDGSWEPVATWGLNIWTPHSSVSMLSLNHPYSFTYIPHKSICLLNRFVLSCCYCSVCSSVLLQLISSRSLVLLCLWMDEDTAETSTFSPGSALCALVFHIQLHVLFLQLSLSQRNMWIFISAAQLAASQCLLSLPHSPETSLSSNSFLCGLSHTPRTASFAALVSISALGLLDLVWPSALKEQC